MWIIPKNIPCSVSAPDTVALISELPELSEACAQSLMWRSTVSPARTWSQRWKRNSWMHHLSGRILKRSHQKSFTDAWTSSLLDTRVNRSPLPENEKASKMSATSGHTYRGQLQLFALDASSLRTSKDILPPGLKTSCGTWESLVTKLRLDCLRRLNAARSTSVNESLSSGFPTLAARDSKGANSKPFSRRGGGKKGEQLANFIAHFPTPTVPGSHCTGTMQEWGGSNNGQRVQDHTDTDGNQDEQSTDLWPTATECGNHNRKGLSQTSGDGLSTAVKNWQTPNVPNGGRVNPPEMSPTGQMPDGSKRQVGLENQAKQWPTPRTITGGAESAERKQELVRKESGGGDLQSATKGPLNPRWVETLMGIPIGWTMPSCVNPQTPGSMSCDCAGTAYPLHKQNSQSEPCTEN